MYPNVPIRRCTSALDPKLRYIFPRGQRSKLLVLYRINTLANAKAIASRLVPKRAGQSQQFLRQCGLNPVAAALILKEIDILNFIMLGEAQMKIKFRKILSSTQIVSVVCLCQVFFKKLQRILTFSFFFSNFVQAFKSDWHA